MTQWQITRLLVSDNPADREAIENWVATAPLETAIRTLDRIARSGSIRDTLDECKSSFFFVLIFVCGLFLMSYLMGLASAPKFGSSFINLTLWPLSGQIAGPLLRFFLSYGRQNAGRRAALYLVQLDEEKAILRLLATWTARSSTAQAVFLIASIEEELARLLPLYQGLSSESEHTICTSLHRFLRASLPKPRHNLVLSDSRVDAILAAIHYINARGNKEDIRAIRRIANLLSLTANQHLISETAYALLNPAQQVSVPTKEVATYSSRDATSLQAIGQRGKP